MSLSMQFDRAFVPPDPESVGGWPGDVEGAPVPDVVDLVLEAATMEAVFAAQRLVRVDAMRRELLADAAGRGAGVAGDRGAVDPVGAGRGDADHGVRGGADDHARRRAGAPLPGRVGLPRPVAGSR